MSTWRRWVPARPPLPAAAIGSVAVLLAAMIFLSGCVAQPRRANSVSPEQELELAQASLQSGQWKLARERFQALTSPIHPSSIQGNACVGLANCAIVDSNWHAALQQLQRAQMFLGDDPRVCSLLARTYLELSEFELTRINLERAFPYMEVGEERQNTAYLLSLLYEREGRGDLSQRYLRESGVLVGPHLPSHFRAWRDKLIPALPPTPSDIASKAPAASEALPTGPLKIIARSTWGARKTHKNVVRMGNKSRITVHHTGEENYAPPDDREGLLDYLRRLQRHAQGQRDMADIPYHYLIDQAGKVYEGRSLQYQGAHAGSGKANRNNIGVALIGNFESSRPPAAQLRSLTRLVRQLQTEHRIPRSKLYTHQRLKEIEGLPYTACPGRHLSAVLGGLFAEADLGPRDVLAADVPGDSSATVSFQSGVAAGCDCGHSEGSICVSHQDHNH